MTLAFNLGASFRLTDWLAVAAQVRFATTNNSYKAHLNNMSFTIGGQSLPASAVLAGNPYAALVEQELDVKQKGFSVSPIIALAFQKNGWAASVKYEFKMATELENKTTKDINLGTGGMFPNGAIVENETPALLAVAASREIGPVKVTLGWHHYFDKAAKNAFTKNTAQGIYNNQYCTVKGNTNEFLLGAEWQISERWLVSAGTQRTQFNFNEQYYSDMNFTNSSWSVGLGLAFKVSETIRINAGYMTTLYDEVEVSGIHAFGGQSLGQFTDLHNDPALFSLGVVPNPRTIKRFSIHFQDTENPRLFCGIVPLDGNKNHPILVCNIHLHRVITLIFGVGRIGFELVQGFPLITNTVIPLGVYVLNVIIVWKGRISDRRRCRIRRGFGGLLCRCRLAAACTEKQGYNRKNV